MRYLSYNIVFQEVPDEISLAFQITGCRLVCKGCHSKELWNPKSGEILTDDIYHSLIKKYNGMISCVLFFGGEWHEEELIRKLEIAQNYRLCTCLYTGEDDVSTKIKENLDYIKVGRWIEELGPLSSTTTNQKFIKLKTNEELNGIFRQ